MHYPPFKVHLELSFHLQWYLIHPFKVNLGLSFQFQLYLIPPFKVHLGLSLLLWLYLIPPFQGTFRVKFPFQADSCLITFYLLPSVPEGLVCWEGVAGKKRIKKRGRDGLKIWVGWERGRKKDRFLNKLREGGGICQIAILGWIDFENITKLIKILCVFCSDAERVGWGI